LTRWARGETYVLGIVEVISSFVHAGPWRCWQWCGQRAHRPPAFRSGNWPSRTKAPPGSPGTMRADDGNRTRMTSLEGRSPAFGLTCGHDGAGQQWRVRV